MRRDLPPGPDRPRRSAASHCRARRDGQAALARRRRRIPPIPLRPRRVERATTAGRGRSPRTCRSSSAAAGSKRRWVRIAFDWAGAARSTPTADASAFADLARGRGGPARLASTAAERSEWFERMAHTDPLTGLANERTVGRMLELELARAGRQGSEVSLAMFDVDDFRRPTSGGHEAGDDVLRPVAAVARRVGPAGRHRRRARRRRVRAGRPGLGRMTVARRVLDGIAALPAVAGRRSACRPASPASRSMARMPESSSARLGQPQHAPGAEGRASRLESNSGRARAARSPDRSSRPADRPGPRARCAGLGSRVSAGRRAGGQSRSLPEVPDAVGVHREASERDRGCSGRIIQASYTCSRRRRQAAHREHDRAIVEPPRSPRRRRRGRPRRSCPGLAGRAEDGGDRLIESPRAVQLGRKGRFQPPTARSPGPQRSEGPRPARPSPGSAPNGTTGRSRLTAGVGRRGSRGGAADRRRKTRRAARSAAAAAMIRCRVRRAARPLGTGTRAGTARPAELHDLGVRFGAGREVLADGRHRRPRSSAPARTARRGRRTSRGHRLLLWRPRLGRRAADPSSPTSPAHREQPQAHPALDGAERRAGPGGDLLLREAAEVGELDRFALDVGQRRRARGPSSAIEAAPRPPPRRRAASGRRGGMSSRSGSSTVGRRRRTASIARWWTIESSHVFTLPRPSMYRAAFRHAPRKASWTTSSASVASFVMRRRSSRPSSCIGRTAPRVHRVLRRRRGQDRPVGLVDGVPRGPGARSVRSFIGVCAAAPVSVHSGRRMAPSDRGRRRPSPRHPAGRSRRRRRIAPARRQRAPGTRRGPGDGRRGRTPPRTASIVAGRLAREPDLGGQVQQDRQVGAEAVRSRRSSSARSAIERNAGAVALVGERRVGEPGADDRPSRRRAPGE